MASLADDLTQFIEGRLQAWDASIDLSAGSPAQIQIVQPIVDKLAEDPFSTDISKFIRDRMLQEFPEMVADNGGLLEDILTKPLQMLLEPVKREILRVRNNQSIAALDLMSDDEADAISANWFASRNIGNVVTGPVRVYFAAPNTVRITTDKVLTTPSGLNFFPSQTYFISSAQMAFNREGSLYYLDIVVIAEQAGEQYNVKKGEISDLQDVPGVIKVANLYDMGGGRPKQTNSEFISYIEQSLTERSLVTKRGAITRITQLFDSVRALQVLGAGEPGMDRDVLMGTGEGSLFLVAGSVTVSGTWMWLSDILFKDNGTGNDVILQVGDTVRFQTTPPGPDWAIYTAKVVRVTPTDPGETEAYLLTLDRELDVPAASGRAVVLKPGFITISEVPGGMSVEATVPEGQVHLGGHVDVFARPTSDVDLQTSIQNVVDDEPLVAGTNFTVPSEGAPARVSNIVSSSTVGVEPQIDFLLREVQVGDLLALETGDLFAGTYHILAVSQYQLRVDAIFSAYTGTGEYLRGRIIRNLHVSLNEPRQIKLPFGVFEANNLQTVVGSALFQFPNLSLPDYGVAKGDTVRILDGPDAGDFVIDSIVANGAVMETAATATGSSLRYQIFSKSTGITFPLVRIKGFEVLDSTGQGTGITVPYGDAVDARPAIGMEGAGEVFEVFDKNLIVWPGVSSYGSPVYSSVDAGHDARYTQKIETADGVVKKLSFDVSNAIHEVEINIPPFLYNGRRNTLLILPNEPDLEFTSSAAGNHRTSPIARSKVGDSIAILDGPNQGKYLIRDLRVLDLWGANAGTTGHQHVALVQVDPELPADPISSAMAMITALGGTPITYTDLVAALGWASDWYNASGFWMSVLIQRLHDVLDDEGITLTEGEVATLLGSQCLSSYNVGPSAHGDLRLYFLEPASTELYYQDDPTMFEVILNAEKLYRLDPNMAPAQIFPESEMATPPQEWLRDGLCPLDGSAYLALGSGSAYAKRGVHDGDLLEYYAPVNCLLGRGSMSTSFLCCTQAGSNIIQLLLPNTTLAGAIKLQTAIALGMPFFVDSGPDFGAYSVTEVLDPITMPVSGLPVVRFRVDRALSHSTLGFPTMDLSLVGSRSYTTFEEATARGDTNKLYVPVRSSSPVGPDGSTAFLAGTDKVRAGKWVTLFALNGASPTAPCYEFGSDTPYLGTFEITADAVAETEVGPFEDWVYITLDKSSFPASGSLVQPRGDQQVLWVIHDAPTDAPLDTSDGGKNLSSQFVRWRMFAQLPQQTTISIPWTLDPNPITPATPDVYTKQILLTPAVVFTDSFGHKMPYRITRPGVYRQSSTAIAKNREGALYYLDVPAIGLGPGAGMNIDEETALRMTGRSRISGYTLEVENKALTYSTKERLSVILPASVLPVGSTPDLDNEIRLSGQTLRVSYNEAPVIDELQDFFDSPSDRVLIANSLVRHFLPGYVFLDAQYTGGSQIEIMTADLITLINNISPDYNQLTVDAIVTALKMRGATQVTTPITLLALVHGIDRRIRGIRSKNAIGAGSPPLFEGNFTQTYFIAGPDTSKLSPRPTGEQVFLSRS